MSGTDPEPRSAPYSGRGAVVISQTYYYVVAAIGLVLLLAGAIEALIALRKWVLPLSETAESSGVFRGSADSNETPRSFLGALAVAAPAPSCCGGISARRADVMLASSLERRGAVSSTSTWSRWSRC